MRILLSDILRFGGYLGMCLSLVMFFACEPAEERDVSSSNALAVSPDDWKQEDSNVGAAKSPEFVSSDEKLPEPSMVWEWSSNQVLKRSGWVRRKVWFEWEHGEILCEFLSEHTGVGCTSQGPDQIVGARSVEWTHLFDEQFAGAGDMVVHGHVLYTVHHTYTEPGAKLSAFCIYDGDLLWSKQLKALEHDDLAEGMNETQIIVDEKAKVVTVFGLESSTSYVEHRRLDNGELVAHTTYNGLQDEMHAIRELVSSPHLDQQERKPEGQYIRQEDCKNWSRVNMGDSTSTVLKFDGCKLLDEVELPRTRHDLNVVSQYKVSVSARKTGEFVIRVLQLNNFDPDVDYNLDFESVTQENYFSSEGVLFAQFYPHDVISISCGRDLDGRRVDRSDRVGPPYLDPVRKAK